MKDDYDYYSNGYSDKYSVIYKSSSGFYDYRRQYTGSFEHYDVETLETDEEKSARLLKEKAVKRNDKIDKLLISYGIDFWNKPMSSLWAK